MVTEWVALLPHSFWVPSLILILGCALHVLPYLCELPLGSPFSPLAFHKHADKGIGVCKLSLGVNEGVNMCVWCFNLVNPHQVKALTDDELSF